MQRSSEQKLEETWRHRWFNNWFIQNTVAEVPVIGGFFRIEHGIHHSVKSGFMLAGGILFMVIKLIPSNEADSQWVELAKQAVNMGTGMAIGMILFNVLSLIGNICTNAVKECCQSQQQEHEDEASRLLNII